MGKNTEVLMVRFSVRPFRCRKWSKPSTQTISWEADDFRDQVEIARMVGNAKNRTKAIAMMLLNRKFPKNRGVRIHGLVGKRGTR
jgi:hypothetical protein